MSRRGLVSNQRLFKRQSSEQLKFDKMYRQVKENLKTSKEKFEEDEDKIGVAKANLLMAEFVINYDS